MTPSAPVARYTGIAMLLHWTVALLIGLNLVLVWLADKWPQGWVRPVPGTLEAEGGCDGFFVARLRRASA